jgi:hypothetical protein
MTSEPLPAECTEARRRLAEDDSGGRVLAHLASCQGCSAFAAALSELDARLTQLELPEPPAGAADRAIARFRAEVAAGGAPGDVPLTPPPSPLADTAPPSQASPARPPRISRAHRRRWRRPVSLAAAASAAIAVVVALVAVLGPASTPPAYAAILHEAAAHTSAEKSARFDLTGSLGFSLRGQHITAPLSGTGATVFPDRGELTEVSSLLGRRLQQHIVSVGNRVWTRTNGGQWTLIRMPPDHASPIDQAIAYPARALNELTRVGSGYRSLGTTTIDGTRVRQIQVTIPGGSFHAFGGLLPQQVRHWTVVAAVSEGKLILRRITIAGRGVVGVLSLKVPFHYSLRLTLRDYGAKVSIQPPPGA